MKLNQIATDIAEQLVAVGFDVHTLTWRKHDGLMLFSLLIEGEHVEKKDEDGGGYEMFETFHHRTALQAYRDVLRQVKALAWIDV